MIKSAVGGSFVKEASRDGNGAPDVLQALILGGYLSMAKECCRGKFP